MFGLSLFLGIAVGVVLVGATAAFNIGGQSTVETLAAALVACLIVLSAKISHGVTAIAILLAESFGLMVPKLAIDYLSERSMQGRS